TTDADTHTTSFVFDRGGRVKAMIEAFGTAHARTTGYAYNRDDGVVTTTDPNGKLWTVVLDLLNRQVGTVDPDGNTTANGFDAAGNDRWSRDADNNLTTVTRDVA